MTGHDRDRRTGELQLGVPQAQSASRMKDLGHPLLRLQRSVGNQAVTGLVSQGPAPVQRKAGSAEFIPQLSVRPEQQTARIGQSFREDLRVLNWRDAPAGTHFEWGGGPLEAEATQHGGITPADRHGSARLTGTALRPGRAEVGANLAYQVPGGPELTQWGPRIPVTTPRPGLLLRYVTTPPPRGGVVQLSRLAIGDRMTIQVVVQDVDRGARKLPHVFNASATSNVLDVVEDHDVPGDAVTHEYTLQAKKAGTFNYSFGWQVAETGMEEVRSSNDPGSVEMSRDDFNHKCASAHQLVDGKYDLIGAYTKDLAIMYGQAWQRHTGALTGANARRQLIADLIISGALAFVTGGVGGAVGRYVAGRVGKDLYKGVMAGDAFKDLVKDTSRRFARANINLPTAPAFEAFPTDPSTWQNKEEAAILRESGHMKLLIASWSKATENPEFLTDFDPYETIEQKLTVAGHKPEELGTPDPNEALRFEKGFWMEWLGQYGYEVTTPVGYGGPRVDDNLDKPIKERVNACAKALGEDGDDWITRWAEPAKQRAEKQKKSLREAGW